MKVKQLVLGISPTERWLPDHIYDLPPAEAKARIAAGSAVAVEEPPKKEVEAPPKKETK